MQPWIFRVWTRTEAEFKSLKMKPGSSPGFFFTHFSADDYTGFAKINRAKKKAPLRADLATNFLKIECGAELSFDQTIIVH